MTNVMLALALASHAFHLPKGLLSALCYVETKHVVLAYNSDDGRSPSLGLCQVKLATARQLGFTGTAQDLLSSARRNAYYAGAYLHYQLRRYHGSVVSAVAAYNAGSVKYKHGRIANSAYVNKVMKAWREHR